MSKKVKAIVELLEADGWFFKPMGKGSPMIYRHSIKSGIAVVPNRGLTEELKFGMEEAILKQAGFK